MPAKSATITTSAAKPHSRPMSSFFGLCFGPISGEETVPPGTDAYQSVWPCGASARACRRRCKNAHLVRTGCRSVGRRPGRTGPPRRCRTRSPCPAAAGRTAPCQRKRAVPARARRSWCKSARRPRAGHRTERRCAGRWAGRTRCFRPVGTSGDTASSERLAARAAWRRRRGRSRRCRTAARRISGRAWQNLVSVLDFSHCNIRLSILQSILCVLYSHYLIF